MTAVDSACGSMRWTTRAGTASPTANRTCESWMARWAARRMFRTKRGMGARRAPAAIVDIAAAVWVGPHGLGHHPFGCHVVWCIRTIDDPVPAARAR